MEQKFLLVDCQTVLFGSYSFTWSFEKIHLSMVQVITGQLVQLYDEGVPDSFRSVRRSHHALLSRKPGQWARPGAGVQGPVRPGL
ncbi:hypothetical protein SKAU_G00165110 [Synaphobranchus kaupii]|uniref:Scaffolding anchor of CK1 domain-containing protein n=1 Tax=Synaphobranchus kaupii TaxID=118154 RepID=A0A9Q1IZ94_SYNKA|nr:hypothetical protein SKAU_G00165110 [Synaphobranchus kaupii]